MARIRTIKPDFFTSADIIGMSIAARFLYSGLWCESDREGRFKMSPKTLKIRYLPEDDCNIIGLLRELVSAGLVVPYGNGLAYIPTFTRHQVINNKESESSLPPPPADCSKYVEEFLSREYDATFTRENEESPLVADGPQPSSKEPVTEVTFTRESRVKVATYGKEGKEGRKEEIHTSPDGEVAAAPDDFSPDEKPKREKATLSARDVVALGVTEQVAKDWLEVRKRKKAPLTQTAMDSIVREAQKAGYEMQQVVEMCCERSWIAFKAEWVDGKASQSAYEKQMADIMRRGV